MKFLIKYGWIILLVGVILTACGTPTPMSPVEVQMTSMAAQVQACATLQAIGTPYPCNPPTSTPTPPPTPTLPPTPTKIPFTGWVLYPNDGKGERQEMPPGFIPPCQDTTVEIVGCPGEMYIYEINGVPQPPEQGGFQATPGYWSWLPFVILGGIGFFVIIGIAMYGATAPQRALAESIKATSKVQAKLLEMSGLSQPALQAPKQVRAGDLWVYFQRFIQECHPDQRFETAMRHHMRAYHRKEALISLETLAGWVHDFDQANETQVLEAFTAFADRNEFNLQLVERSS